MQLSILVGVQVLAPAIEYANQRKLSVSELVGKSLVGIINNTNVIDKVKKLETPSINEHLKELFYKEQFKKYGFCV